MSHCSMRSSTFRGSRLGLGLVTALSAITLPHRTVDARRMLRREEEDREQATSVTENNGKGHVPSAGTKADAKGQAKDSTTTPQEQAGQVEDLTPPGDGSTIPPQEAAEHLQDAVNSAEEDSARVEDQLSIEARKDQQVDESGSGHSAEEASGEGEERISPSGELITPATLTDEALHPDKYLPQPGILADKALKDAQKVETAVKEVADSVHANKGHFDAAIHRANALDMGGAGSVLAGHAEHVQSADQPASTTESESSITTRPEGEDSNVQSGSAGE
ncbi:unnamed protein product [Amoebophrya sp. A25]|nr:unnamed protein product [Amoebophrya sp. A25]|eukprot:GSA25T00024084001.1